MAKRKKPENKIDGRQTATAKNRSRNIFAETNRGMLLDIFIFVVNLFLMRLLTRLFIDVFRQADADDRFAKLTLGLTCLAMWILPAAGAVLKRWHFHRRRGLKTDAGQSALSGCLFNPIFYFCLNLVIMSAVLAGLGEQLFGKALTNNGAVFVPLVFVGLGMTIVQTYLIFRYLSPPKAAPKSSFMKGPLSEALGDVCIFVNMILFQVAWNLLTYSPLGRVSGFAEFAGRLFFLCFIAMLIYFPPRMFYLAEDINRRQTWLTMLLANSPVIVRVLIGTGSG
jgi:hypothetical protein